MSGLIGFDYVTYWANALAGLLLCYIEKCLQCSLSHSPWSLSLEPWPKHCNAAPHAAAQLDQTSQVHSSSQERITMLHAFLAVAQQQAGQVDSSSQEQITILHASLAATQQGTPAQHTAAARSRSLRCMLPLGPLPSTQQQPGADHYAACVPCCNSAASWPSTQQQPGADHYAACFPCCNSAGVPCSAHSSSQEQITTLHASLAATQQQAGQAHSSSQEQIAPLHTALKQLSRRPIQMHRPMILDMCPVHAQQSTQGSKENTSKRIRARVSLPPPLKPNMPACSRFTGSETEITRGACTCAQCDKNVAMEGGGRRASEGEGCCVGTAVGIVAAAAV
eukprot:1157854-Pelagomonas_calceolata.AAC.2